MITTHADLARVVSRLHSHALAVGLVCAGAALLMSALALPGPALVCGVVAFWALAVAGAIHIGDELRRRLR